MKLQWILLLGACAVVRADYPPKGYYRFVKNHITRRMAIQDCTGVMGTLELNNSADGTCKYTNTFIVVDPNGKLVEKVCNNAGTRTTRNIYTSNQPFSLITCRIFNGTHHPNCVYRGKASTRRIKVGCLGKQNSRWPVHFDGFV